MNALVLKDKRANFSYQEVPTPIANDSEVIVQIKAAALNHRDVWISKGMYPGIYYPCILGSDGVGLLDGKEVIINPSMNWGANQSYQAADYKILGLPDAGTFAQYVKIPKSHALPMPKHLSMEQAAALPLAGLTAFRAIFTKGQVQAGDNVLISGIGGGVALFAFQFALAAGANVFVTSSSDEKIEKAIEMGAKGGANYTKEGWAKTFGKSTGGFNVIIDSAGGDGFSSLLKLAKSGARIVMYGGTRGNITKLSPQLLFWKQVSILGTTMGSSEEFEHMINYVSSHQIIPIVDKVYSIRNATAAFERMEKGLQFGKIVLTV